MSAVCPARRGDKEFDKKVAIKLIKRGFETDEIIALLVLISIEDKAVVLGN